jgi:hypothetical protein
VDPELTTLIARPSGWQRAQRGPGLVIAGVGVWALFYGQLLGLAMLAVGFWWVAEFWRGIRVTGDTLHMQGRVLRRSLPLAEIRQLGIASRTLWVRPATGRTLVLHMVDVRTDTRGSLDDVHDRLRELAEQAGAELEPLLTERTPPPRPRTPFFGW